MYHQTYYHSYRFQHPQWPAPAGSTHHHPSTSEKTAHLGIVKCRERARQTVWWPGMSTELEAVVKQCEVCRKNLHQWPQPLTHCTRWAHILANLRSPHNANGPYTGQLTSRNLREYVNFTRIHSFGAGLRSCYK